MRNPEPLEKSDDEVSTLPVRDTTPMRSPRRDGAVYFSARIVPAPTSTTSHAPRSVASTCASCGIAERARATIDADGAVGCGDHAQFHGGSSVGMRGARPRVEGLNRDVDVLGQRKHTAHTGKHTNGELCVREVGQFVAR